MTRIAILAEGAFDRLHAKTAIGLLRYRRADVVWVVDSVPAGLDAFACVGEGRGVPVVSSLAEARVLGVSQLAIGIALAGGEVPAPSLRSWKKRCAPASMLSMDCTHDSAKTRGCAKPRVRAARGSSMSVGRRRICRSAGIAGPAPARSWC